MKLLLRTFLITALFNCAAQAQLTNGLYAAFDTSMGGITCRLDYAEAPLTCANFVGLAEGTHRWISPGGAIQSAPFYDGLIFHRVDNGFVIQGGCPLGNGTSGPGYIFPDQISTNILHSKAGILSMANSGPDSNGSQFFITLDAWPTLDGDHAVFGEVVGGMNVVSNIGSVATDSNDRPLTNVVINSVNILRIGSEAAAFSPTNEPLPSVMGLPVTLSTNVSAVTSNQCEQFIYSSTNLTDWTPAATNYSTSSIGKMSLAIPTDQPCGFYRGARAFYPQAFAPFSNLEGKTLRFQQESTILEFQPAEGGLGTCTIAGTPDTLTHWADLTSGPYPASVVFQTSAPYAFFFELGLSGRCNGYQYFSDQWYDIGTWTFSEQ